MLVPALHLSLIYAPGVDQSHDPTDVEGSHTLVMHPDHNHMACKLMLTMCLQAARASEWLANAVEQGQTLVASLITFLFTDVFSARQVFVKLCASTCPKH